MTYMWPIDDPNRPGTPADMRELSAALHGIPAEEWERHMVKTCHVSQRSELTHVQAVGLARWARLYGQRKPSR